MFKPHPSLFVLLACVACGSSFEAGASGGDTGSGGGTAQAGASDSGGDTGASAGESSGGANAAGDSSAGGRAAAGDGGAAQAGTSNGGSSSGGTSPSAGSSSAGGTDCTALKTEYAALVKKARVCEEGSTDQCTTASKAPNVGGCGCPTLVNANSEYTALAAEKYKAIQKNKCEGGLTCNAVCLPPTSASCAKSSGTGSSEFVCTGTSGGIAN